MRVKEIREKNLKMYIVQDSENILVVMSEGELSFWKEIDPNELDLLDLGIEEG